jgi:serine/threonine protein phosphatase PrpC
MCESTLITMQDTDGVILRRVPGGTVAFYSVGSPAKRGDNEDAAAIIPIRGGRAVLAVADGVGGLPAGAHASATALTALRDCVGGATGADELRPLILDGIERANRNVCDLALGAATTLAVVEVDGLRIRPYHVGASEILVVGQRGRLKLQTVSHSPVGYAVEAGLLDQREAIHHEDRNVVSNILGAADMRIEVGPVRKLRPRDTVVVGSDGLFDNLHQEEITDLIRKGPLDEAGAAVADAARRRMLTPRQGHPSKPDDLTFLLFRPAPPSGRDAPAET